MILLQANAFNLPLPSKSVDCAVTSPPYYSLRKYSGEQEFVFGGDKNCVHEWETQEVETGSAVYKGTERWQHHGETLTTKPEMYEIGHKGEKRVKISSYCAKCNAWRGAYGLEPTLQMYIDHTVEWCREVHRVLRDDGTFWLNLGDSYAGGGRGGQTEEKLSANWQPDYPDNIIPIGPKPKDLMGIPWRVALALQADGWYLRSDIIWHKTNPMPESVTDRPTKSHEYLFLLTKSKKYYYDADAIREPNTLVSKQRAMRGNSENNKYAAGVKRPPGVHANTMSQPREFKGYDDMEDAIARGETPLHSGGRNKRTVWSISTAPYSGAHFATYPPALVEPCIKAGTSEKGVCPECGNPWERVVETEGSSTWTWHDHGANLEKGSRQTLNDKPAGTIIRENYYKLKRTEIGWRATCEHDLDPIPATVLDPFSGSGTTLMVARKLGRRAIGLDISAEYLDLAKERLSIKALEEWESGKAVPESDYAGTLFENI